LAHAESVLACNYKNTCSPLKGAILYTEVLGPTPILSIEISLSNIIKVSINLIFVNATKSQSLSSVCLF
jgi:hypothetical protein